MVDTIGMDTKPSAQDGITARDKDAPYAKFGVIGSLMKIDTVALRKPKGDKYLPTTS